MVVSASLSAQTIQVVGDKVGVGTATPNAKLEVAGDVSSSGADLIPAYGPAAGIRLTDESSYVYLRPYHAATGDKPLQIGPGPGGIRIDAAGNVGIGTTTPGAKRSVAGTFNADGPHGAVVTTAAYSPFPPLEFCSRPTR